MADDILTLTAQIAAAYLNGAAAAGTVKPEDVSRVIREIHSTLAQPSAAPTATSTSVEDAAPLPNKRLIAKSITPDALISFVDGKPYKTLKRHLTTHGLTIDGYKAKFGLPADYPTVAPNYSAARSAMAKSIGLGAKIARKPAPKARVKRAAKTA